MIEGGLGDNVFIAGFGDERLENLFLVFLLVLVDSEEKLCENPPQRF